MDVKTDLQCHLIVILCIHHFTVKLQHSSGGTRRNTPYSFTDWHVTHYIQSAITATQGFVALFIGKQISKAAVKEKKQKT